MTTKDDILAQATIISNKLSTLETDKASISSTLTAMQGEIDDAQTALAQIVSLMDECECDESSYPAWLPTLGGVAPNYHADYVNSNYWANESEQANLASFLTGSGFAGTTNLNTGLYCGPARTNKLFPSNDFSTWTKDASSVALDSGWQKITENTANSAHQIYKAVSFTSGQLHTLSGKFKAGTASKFRLWLTAAAIGFYVDVDLSAGTIGSATSWGGATSLSAGITSLGSGEYHVWVSGVCSPVSQAYFDIAIMNGSSWQYTGTSRYIYAKECQFELGPLTAYIPTTTAAVTVPTSQLTRTITAPTYVTKRMKIKIAPQSAVDYEVFYHLDNNQNNANYADTELYRYTTNLYVRTTHQNTIYRESTIAVANSDTVTVAWTTSASGLLVSFNGATAVSLSGDTFESLIKERINGNITGDRIANGNILEDATWFVTATAGQLESLST